MDRRELILGTAVSFGALISSNAFGQNKPKIAQLANAIFPNVVKWRRHLHQNPELSNREFKTAEFVANELNRLGFKVKTKIAHTGVVGILEGGKTGPVVALRADMDALPVLEKTNLEFASKQMGEYEGRQVPIAHACGHDAHVAMLLGAANVLNAMKKDIAGKVVFIFQPAEEGPPKGEAGGAKLMIDEGVLESEDIKSIFGIHVWNGKAGEISYKPKGMMAGSDRVEIILKGKQTHGSAPWTGIDLSSLAADIVNSINQIVARRINLTEEPSVFSITMMHGGDRYNIIPEEFKLSGTLRTFSDERRQDIIEKTQKSVQSLAQSYGAEANISFQRTTIPTINDIALSQNLYKAMVAATMNEALVNNNALPVTASEDFSQFQRKVAGLYAFLGVSKPNFDPKSLPVNHSPYFDIYEPAMETGVRAHCEAAMAMLNLYK